MVLGFPFAKIILSVVLCCVVWLLSVGRVNVSFSLFASVRNSKRSISGGIGAGCPSESSVDVLGVFLFLSGLMVCVSKVSFDRWLIVRFGFVFIMCCFFVRFMFLCVLVWKVFGT